MKIILILLFIAIIVVGWSMIFLLVNPLLPLWFIFLPLIIFLGVIVVGFLILIPQIIIYILLGKDEGDEWAPPYTDDFDFNLKRHHP